VAAMAAVAAACGIQLEGRELALLCQRVENAVVGEIRSSCIAQNRTPIMLLCLLCGDAAAVGPSLRC